MCAISSDHSVSITSVFLTTVLTMCVMWSAHYEQDC
jgi:hypothetical protein